LFIKKVGTEIKGSIEKYELDNIGVELGLGRFISG
jgi:hypothetical protein